MLFRVECIQKLVILSTSWNWFHDTIRIYRLQASPSFTIIVIQQIIEDVNNNLYTPNMHIKSWSRTTLVWYTSCGSCVVVLKPVLSCSAVIVLERMLLEVLRSWGSSDCIVSVTTAVEAFSLAVRAVAWANTSSRVALLPKILSACNRYQTCNFALEQWALSAKALYTYARLN